MGYEIMRGMGASIGTPYLHFERSFRPLFGTLPFKKVNRLGEATLSQPLMLKIHMRSVHQTISWLQEL